MPFGSKRARSRCRSALAYAEIGRKRFWLGVAAALGFAVTFYRFVGALRDAVTVIILAFGDGRAAWLGVAEAAARPADAENPLGLAPGMRYAQNLCVAGIAVAVAQSMAFRMWLAPQVMQKRRRRHRMNAWATPTMWTWLIG